MDDDKPPGTYGSPHNEGHVWKVQRFHRHVSLIAGQTWFLLLSLLVPIAGMILALRLVGVAVPLFWSDSPADVAPDAAMLA